MEPNKNEKWKQLIDTGLSCYYVSTDGMVYNSKKGKMVSVILNKKTGYCSVSLWDYKNKRKINKYIHRLVAEIFIPNPDKKAFVDHIDTNKNNNSVENLRWVTQKENVRNKLTLQHMKENHVDCIGEKNSFFGKNHSVLSKEKMREAKIGEKNPCFGRRGEKHPLYGKAGTTKDKKRYFNEETKRYYYK